MKLLLYYIFKVFIKTSLFFHSKRIRVVGKNNIPKTGAVMFLANHPNGLLDPILIASNTARKTHFLVKADIFNNPKIATFFGWLGLIPIYRMRDGRKQLAKNNLIFKQCRNLLKDNKTLLIFPEGTHNKKRTIRRLNKGFTRIVFGTLDEHPDVNINIVPVGITYQDSSKYPSEVAVHFGKPIDASTYYDTEDAFQSARDLKEEVAVQLKALSVHINNDESYDNTIQKLNQSNVDFTDIDTVNTIIKHNEYQATKTKQLKRSSFLKGIIIVNSFLPYLLWKKIEPKVPDIEFKDSFRLTINSITFPFFYILQGFILALVLHWKAGLLYVLGSLLLVLIHTKTAKNIKIKLLAGAISSEEI